VLLIIPKIRKGSTSKTPNPRFGMKKANAMATLPKTNATGIPNKRSAKTRTNIDIAIINFSIYKNFLQPKRKLEAIKKQKRGAKEI
jgi:hypothetical protein